MNAHPIPSDFETRTNAMYEALMWALSRPGLVRRLPTAGPSAIVEALLDRECAVYCDDTELSQIASRTGAAIVAPEVADHLFLTQEPDNAVLTSLRQGSDMYPEDGATLILPAGFGTGFRLRLTGPGVDGALGICISGISSAFWAARTRIMRYPIGFEVFLLDGDQVMGLPRSTSIEVL